MGVDKIKKVLGFVLSLAEAIDLAKQDGKIDLRDVAYLLDPLMKVGEAIASAKEALEELKNLSPEEKAELDAWVQAEFDISNDGLEVKIEKGLGLALNIAEFVQVVRS